MLLIGLISGTSVDGVDAALVEITGRGRGTRARLRAFQCTPYSPPMRAAILRLCDPRTASVPELCALDFALGERLAEAARSVADTAGVPLADIDAIASHGQTIWHQPTPLPIADTASTGTLQIGRPAVITALTGCTVVADFRAADMAVGGQGAPLVPYADWALLTSERETRAVQNIGGIANVTYLPRAAEPEEILAFDTGPGNILLDALVRRFTSGEKTYDEDGAWAAQGELCPALLEWILTDPFFETPPPKTTGRERFGDAFMERLLKQGERYDCRPADLLLTAATATVEAIDRAYRRWLTPRHRVETVIVGGGGARNKTLMCLLAERLAPARVTTHAEFGIPDDAKEAIAFALLGYETLRGRPSNLPAATGAARPVLLGTITPGPRTRIRQIRKNVTKQG